MLTVQRMKPFLMSQEDFRLRLVFAYQYFSILKGEEVFQFIPSEGKEIVVNLNSLQVENLGEVFVFQRGSRFIRLPLYQLLLISDLHVHLSTILEGVVEIATDSVMPKEVAKEAEGIIVQLEMENKWRMIDFALETNDRQLFNELTEGMQ
ncbi:transcriptional regulator [Sporosarcina sp. 179-K 3D1 HS]|uniref:transcriptional regulator n=1 Tax=Sporosarcina sp. 179-K 3D1 HS TaxID=3232169 RepID=UPI0039A30498